MSTLYDLEPIEINEEEFEEIIFNRLSKYPYPVLQFGTQYIYFNAPCTNIFDPTHVKFQLSSEYLVILPSNGSERNAYVFQHPKNFKESRRVTFPASIKGRKAVKCGWYKCYRYKDGLAIKRYEPLEVKEDG